MRTIGILGGMSWQSTALYYQLINQEIASRLGGLHSAKILIESFDLESIAQLQASGEWGLLAKLLIDSATRLQTAGADCILIATNTMHKVADDVQAAITIPLIHIVDVTATNLLSDGVTGVGLLGTRFSMEDDFFLKRLEKVKINCLVPDRSQRDEMHRIIFEELCRGELNSSSRCAVQRMIQDLAERGATGIILGCTEIPLLISAKDSCLPLFDTSQLHALAAVEFALQGREGAWERSNSST